MRLTLRTLLAYLDDTLEASEIKNIGQKVAESDAAQELVARIKQVTRRRRLTVPTDGGMDQRFDANRVAAYLDNELSADEIAEVEKICLESDVHLAEMAACHQILTLVLGEPALIPPTSRRRMYGLIQGRPVRSASRPALAPKSVSGTSTQAGVEADPDDSLMALPLFRNLPWLRWALPLSAVVLLAVLAVFLFTKLGGSGDGRVVKKDPPANGTPADPSKDANRTTDGPKPTPRDTEAKKTTEFAKTTESARTTDQQTTGGVQPIPAVSTPSTQRQLVGSFAGRENAGKALVRRDGTSWKRVPLGGQIHSTDPLVSLPGYRSEVRLESGVDVLLWGNLPEMQLDPLPLLESAVTFHQPSSGIDADLTLHRGRIYLTNKKEKGPATVRLRFWREEVWDVTLDEPDTQVGVELMSLYLAELKPREGEEPLVQTTLYVARGTVTLKVDKRTFGDLKAPPGRSLVLWNNKGAGVSGPHPIDAKIPLWEIVQQPPKEPEQVGKARHLEAALVELAGALTDPEKRVSIALMEYIEGKEPGKRTLGVRCLAAVDAVSELLDILAKDDVTRFDVRQEALFALTRNWLSRGKEQGAKLYDAQNKSGLLIDRGFSNREAQIILDLLYGPSADERNQRELYDVLISYLLSNRLIVRELAIRHLLFLTRNQFKIDYNPAGPAEQREMAYLAWKKLLDDKKLPPTPPPPKPDPGPK